MRTPGTRGHATDRLGRAIALRWEQDDRWWLLTPVVVSGAFGAIALAAFGLPPIALHGPWHYQGVMSPTCGMTRAVRSFAQGQIGLALRYNPAVLVLVAAYAGALARSGWGLATGRWLHISIRRARPLVVLALVAVVALWVHQQAKVDLIGP